MGFTEMLELLKVIVRQDMLLGERGERERSVCVVGVSNRRRECN